MYITELHAWCAEAGAVSLDEVRDNAENLVASVGFAEAERRKLWSTLGVEEARAEKLRLEDEKRQKLADEEAELMRKRLKKEQREETLKELKKCCYANRLQMFMMCSCCALLVALSVSLALFVSSYSGMKSSS